MLTADETLHEICRRAWRLGVSVLVSTDRSVDCDGVPTGGYFDCEGVPTIAVSGGRDVDQWLGILLHEFNHACQWAEQAEVWKAAEASDPMWEWLNGKNVRNVAAKIAAARELEADCERRTVRLIREIGAPIDVERYCRAANAYVHFYNTLAVARKWYAPGRGPYQVPEVLALCNSTLDRDFSKTPPKLAKALLGCV